MMLDLYLPGVFFQTLLGIISLSILPLVLYWPVSVIFRKINKILSHRL